MVRPSVRSIIHSLKLVDFLSVQADKPCSISLDTYFLFDDISELSESI